ncbi:hypothetical protein AB990_20940 [Alkalihalobacillus pseudalcaliphilus]|nr:hypothetical protein AB990_20940 [Alkalihalobacillus pseudalcaliphilus]
MYESWCEHGGLLVTTENYAPLGKSKMSSSKNTLTFFIKNEKQNTTNERRTDNQKAKFNFHACRTKKKTK